MSKRKPFVELCDRQKRRRINDELNSLKNKSDKGSHNYFESNSDTDIIEDENYMANWYVEPLQGNKLPTRETSHALGATLFTNNCAGTGSLTSDSNNLLEKNLDYISANERLKNCLHTWVIREKTQSSESIDRLLSILNNYGGFDLPTNVDELLNQHLAPKSTSKKIKEEQVYPFEFEDLDLTFKADWTESSSKDPTHSSKIVWRLFSNIWL